MAESKAAAMDVDASDLASFDLPRYIGRYRGLTRLQRLRYIAAHSSSCPALQQQSAMLLLDELKQVRSPRRGLSLSDVHTQILCVPPTGPPPPSRPPAHSAV